MKKLEIVETKIHFNHDTLKTWLAYWRFKEKKIVFTNGCFDLLHQGHVDYLSKAADQGNILIVGLNTDASVSRIKGCLLYTSDAADDLLCVDFGGRRLFKKKKNKER